ncbi:MULTISPECIES: hypothetical protein [unclassified Moraxella]|uniref:hypothetical protein n=1 Tax=unclassified Moraxella TaxID=2685852 RepID=UPI003AF4831C
MIDLMSSLSIFMVYPFIAFIIAVVFWGLGIGLKSKVLKVASLAWVGYGIWEYLMYFKVLCSGDCNIRIDLLVIFPILLLFSVGAVGYVIYRKTRGNQKIR